MFLTKKLKKGGHHDILETFSKYNDKEHQNSEKNYLIIISNSNENTSLCVCYISSKFDGSNKI